MHPGVQFISHSSQIYHFHFSATAVLSTVISALAAEDSQNDFETYGYIPIESSNTVSATL